jgi:hypothetical protein
MIQKVKWPNAITVAPLLSFLLFTFCSQPACAMQAQRVRTIPEKHLGSATASYFSKDKHIAVQSSPLRVAGDWRNGVVLIASFIVPGQKVVKPETVYLEFIVDSQTDARPPLLRVQISSEGREMDSGVPKMVSESKPAGGSVTRILMYKISYDKFIQMLKGKEVRIRVGHVDCDITDEQLASMRDLQRMVAEGVGFP